MRKHDELNNPASCMSRARDNEMTFVLLGRDVAAPAAIRAWAEARIVAKKNRSCDEQIIEAINCASTMERERSASEQPVTRAAVGGRQQQALMEHSPATGSPQPYPSHAAQWRDYHGNTAWLFNPWTGNARAPEDVGSDPYGFLVLPPTEPVYA